MPEQLSILLVEDELLIAELVIEALARGGYDVHHELTGEGATNQLEGARHFSGLVTDVRLPGQTTGWDVARHARRLNPKIAVVYTSGDSGQTYQAEGVPQSRFVQKPFVPDQIITAVSTLLNETPQ